MAKAKLQQGVVGEVAEAVDVAEAKSKAKSRAAEVLHRDTGEVSLAGAALTRAAMQAWQLYQQIAELDAQLSELKERLKQEVPAGCSLVVRGVCRVAVVSTQRVTVSDAIELGELLGERFDDLVKTDVTYRPEPRLVAMAADADDPLAPSIRMCLKVGVSTSVKFSADK